MTAEKDALHEWADRHADWARERLGDIPAEELAWDREAVKDATLAYEAGLQAGQRQGYAAGIAMGMANGLAAAERRAFPTTEERDDGAQ